MDIPRPPRKNTLRNVSLAAGAAIAVVLTFTLTALGPVAPSVDRASVLIGVVRSGDISRTVRAPGNLVPEHTQWITAQGSARVERLVAQSGQAVVAGQLLLELSNPDLQIQTMQAAQQVRQAEIDLLNLRTNLVSQRLAQEGLVATTRAQHTSATEQAVAADSLLKDRFIARLEASQKKGQAAELTARLEIEEQRLDLMKQTIPSQIAVQVAQVAQLRAITAHHENRLRSLRVMSPNSGVLQDLGVQLGQWVPEGTTLAKVVQPGRLKAVLRISESQAKDVQIGQQATVDTRPGLIRGYVSRKDPAAQAGTVVVDVALSGPLPAGAVPDLNIDGTVEIETLKNVLYVGPPASGAGFGSVGLFKLSPTGDDATRVPVVLGRSSVNAVEVLSGIQVGDKVILSDMSQFDGTNRVRLK